MALSLPAGQLRGQAPGSRGGEDVARDYTALFGAVTTLAAGATLTLLDAAIDGPVGSASGASLAQPDLAATLARLQQSSTPDELRQLPLRYLRLFESSEGAVRLEIAGTAAAGFADMDCQLGAGAEDSAAAFALAKLCAVHIGHAD